MKRGGWRHLPLLCFMDTLRMDAENRMKRTPRWRVSLALLLLVFAGSAAQAAKRIDPRAPVFTTTWASGNIAGQINFCVASTDSNNVNTPPVMPYTVSSSIGGTTAPFTLASGANTLPITLNWRDLANNAVFDLSQPTPNSYVAGFPLTGDLRNCPAYTFNARLEIGISATDLAGNPPGNYTRTFNVDVENASGGGGPDKTTYTITVTIPDSIAVTNIDDIQLGTWSGVGNLSGSDSLCVYRAGAATYGVMLTGSGAGGAFVVAQGASTIPLQVTWNDGGGAVAATPGTRVAKTNAFATSSTCNGGAANNATLGVTAMAADLGASTASGDFLGTITINVVAQ